MVRPKQFPVVLSPDERRSLVVLTARGVASARELRRARIVLLAAEDRPDAVVAVAVGCCPATVERVRRRCVEEGVDAALRDRTRPGGLPLLDNAAEAVLVALACSDGDWLQVKDSGRLSRCRWGPFKAVAGRRIGFWW